MPTDDEPPVKKPKVSFAPEVKENLFFSPLLVTKPNSSKFRKKWLEHTDKEEYGQLEQELGAYQQRGGSIKEFFDKEGEVILNWALIGESSTTALDFIIQHISKELIQIKLEQDNHHLLRIFLLGKSIMEQNQQLDLEYFKNLCDKIELLLTIKPETLKKFLKESIGVLALGQQVKASIEKAIVSFERKSITVKQGFFDKPNFH